jgi:uncharacterized protein (UPF0276 family)
MNAAMTAGIGLKPEHYDAALHCAEEGFWVEVHPENYFVDGGPRLAWLEAISGRHPVSLHGVALSLASDAPPDPVQLRRLGALVRRLSPALVSEHLAWSAWRGSYHPDLLPFPRTGEAVRRIADNIERTQDALGRRIAIENPAHYMRLDGHVHDEIDFMHSLVHRTGCSLLLDINNVHVGGRNLGYSAADYIDRFPGEAVTEIHLAGHSIDSRLGDSLLIDSHDAPVAPEVWSLYERFVSRNGPRPTLIERDDNLPDFTELLAERNRAAALLSGAMDEAA